jgi:hypothetical protein
MKNFLLLSLLFIGLNVFAQDNVKMLYYKDIMTDKEYIYTNEKVLCFEGEKKGFIVNPRFEFKKGIFSYHGITVKSVGIGSCVENDDLIILFEDNTKVSLKSWNNFNCDSSSYFDLNANQLNNLTKRIKAIRFQNGRTFESLTFILEKETDKTFFIDVKQAIDKQVYVVVDRT